MTEAEALADSIVRSLRDATSPGQCTWGETYPRAQRELFEDYYEDLVSTVRRRLASG